MRYLLGRLGLFVLTLWAAVTVNFVLPRLMPGSPSDAAIAKLGQNGPVTPAMRQAVEAQLGVPSGSLWNQYVEYLNQVVHFDFGVSYSYFPQTVSGLIGDALPWTLVLVGTVTIIAFVCGTLLGVLAAWKRGTPLDTVPTVGGQFLSAFPYFWTALLLVFFLGYVAGLFPTSGAYSQAATPNWSFAFFGDALYHAILPGVTILLTSLGGVVGGSLLVETVFNYPGVGLLLFHAVTNQDYPLMQALFLMITVSVLIANFIVDVLYGVLDPRTRR